MKRWLIGSMVVLAVLAAIFLLVRPRPGTGPTPTYTPSRTPDGQPDLQGIWQVLNTAAWDLEDHHASYGVPAGRGVVEGGVIPYQPSALTKRRENLEKRATRDPNARCYLPGVPRITYMPFPFQIVQQADKVSLLYEYH